MGVESELPVLSKKIPMPLMGEMGAPPKAGVRRRVRAGVVVSLSLTLSGLASEDRICDGGIRSEASALH